jgi:hypothetical protein
MQAGGPVGWRVSETTSQPVLRALHLRDALGIRLPGLPRLRGVRTPGGAVDPRLEQQWARWWPMVVEPESHRSAVPLSLVDGYGTAVAMPVAGAETLRAAAERLARASERWLADAPGPRAGSVPRRPDRQLVVTRLVVEHERILGRPAEPFALTIEVLPFVRPGLWWIGAATVAVSDTLRVDAAEFRRALRPVIAQLA